jgi:hypothetical protein
MWTLLISLRRASGALLWEQQWTFGYHKSGRISKRDTNSCSRGAVFYAVHYLVPKVSRPTVSFTISSWCSGQLECGSVGLFLLIYSVYQHHKQDELWTVNMARRGLLLLEKWEYDVIATLRRPNAPISRNVGTVLRLAGGVARQHNSRY